MPTQREIFWRTTLQDKNLSSVTQAGLVNNLNDGMAWGLFPLVFAAAQLDLGRIGALAAIYPAPWGLTQLVTGAWSDRVGRKWLIASGMWVQAIGIGVVVLSNAGRADEDRSRADGSDGSTSVAQSTRLGAGPSS